VTDAPQRKGPADEGPAAGGADEPPEPADGPLAHDDAERAEAEVSRALRTHALRRTPPRRPAEREA
jgi:hypothetical protein